MKITGVSDDVAAMIHRHAARPQTGASLQTLMKTGRGEYLHKTYEDHKHDPNDNSKVATDKILMQVAGFLRHELPIRLAHRILDLEGVPHMKEMDSVFVQEIGNMEHITPHTHLKHINTSKGLWLSPIAKH